MNEELKNILSRVDHTLLAQGATWNEIKAICDDGIKYGCAPGRSPSAPSSASPTATTPPPPSASRLPTR